MNHCRYLSTRFSLYVYLTGIHNIVYKVNKTVPTTLTTSHNTRVYRLKSNELTAVDTHHRYA